MHKNRLWSVARIGALVLTLTGAALAQQPRQTKLRGVINDFTPSSVSGPWEVRGEWSLHVNWVSGKAEFSAALTMERSDQGVILNGGGDFITGAGRHAHTHHVIVEDADVTLLANGFRVKGTATVTGNGGPPPDFGPISDVQIDITGGSIVQYSNIKLTFGAPASGHLGGLPFSGVVRNED